MAEYRGSVLPGELFATDWITNNRFHNDNLQQGPGGYCSRPLLMLNTVN